MTMNKRPTLCSPSLFRPLIALGAALGISDTFADTVACDAGEYIQSNTGGYICAAQTGSGEQKIKPYKTKTWSNYPNGSPTGQWSWGFFCWSTNSSAVSITPDMYVKGANTLVPWPLSVSATNWDALHSHDWGVGALWAAGTPDSGAYSSNCGSYGAITATLTSSPPGLQSIGQAAAEPVGMGGVGMGGIADMVGMKVLDKTAVMPTQLTLTCPKGFSPIHAESFSSGSDDAILWETERGVTALPTPNLDGQSVSLQLSCRNKSAKLFSLAYGDIGIALGTVKSDRISTPSAHSAVFGGLGDDELWADKDRSVVLGGLGNDTITVNATDAVAIGGDGNDTLKAVNAGRSLLVGGPGKDTFYGSPDGETHINARDGYDGDLIICKSDKNTVLSDSGDILRGPCSQP
ncbi:hypothetical protein MishRS11D_28700 [Methylomagnum ishizawai]|nr:hypothetical protein MishRS11D_28700 [Methylomagnum ishizawai]